MQLIRRHQTGLILFQRQKCIVPSTGAGFFFANYMKDAVSVVKQYDYNGN
jgi:prolyl oligopeptidase